MTVTVSDEEGNSASQTFTINVNEVNLPPVLEDIADQTVEPDTELTLTAVATDPDIPVNMLTYSLNQEALDAGMTIDPDTGEISWTPTVDQADTSLDVTVTVTDDGDPAASDTTSFTVQVGSGTGGGNPIIDGIAGDELLVRNSHSA